MRCETFEANCTEYLDGALSQAERLKLESHLAQCDECASFLRQLTLIDRELTQALKQPALSPDFARRMQDRIQAESRERQNGWLAQRRAELQIEFEQQKLQMRRCWFSFRYLLEAVLGAVLIGLSGWAVLTWLNSIGTAPDLQEGARNAAVLGAATVAGAAFILVALYGALQQQCLSYCRDVLGMGHLD